MSRRPDLLSNEPDTGRNVAWPPMMLSIQWQMPRALRFWTSLDALQPSSAVPSIVSMTRPAPLRTCVPFIPETQLPFPPQGALPKNSSGLNRMMICVLQEPLCVAKPKMATARSRHRSDPFRSLTSQQTPDLHTAGNPDACGSARSDHGTTRGTIGPVEGEGRLCE